MNELRTKYFQTKNFWMIFHKISDDFIKVMGKKSNYVVNSILYLTKVTWLLLSLYFT